mgnify:CR=1 FL=1
MTHPELRGDWHVHSDFSDDAVSSIAENLIAAAEAGLTEIRLTDHVRIGTTYVPRFLETVAATPVPSGLTVYTGVEAKILDANGTLDIPEDLVVGPGGVDGIVIADHQFPGPDGPWKPERAGEALAEGWAPEAAIEMLVTATVRAMEQAGGSAQLAHSFSILPKIGLDESQLSDDVLRAWAEAAARTGTAIEGNEKWGCPGPRAIRAAWSAGARVVASTDSHIASDVGQYQRVADLFTEARG